MTTVDMTATTSASDTTAAVPVRLPVSGIPTASLVETELRKMFNTRSGFWMLTSIGVLSVLATCAAILFAPDDEVTYESFATAIGRRSRKPPYIKTNWSPFVCTTERKPRAPM